MPLFTDNDRLSWVSDGQRVTLGFDSGRGCRCVVTIAAGNHARVESVKPGLFSDWVPVWRLFPEIPPGR